MHTPDLEWIIRPFVSPLLSLEWPQAQILKLYFTRWWWVTEMGLGGATIFSLDTASQNISQVCKMIICNKMFVCLLLTSGICKGMFCLKSLIMVFIGTLLLSLPHNCPNFPCDMTHAKRKVHASWITGIESKWPTYSWSWSVHLSLTTVHPVSPKAERRLSASASAPSSLDFVL